MALTLSVSPSIPALVPADYVPSLGVSALDTLPDVEFGSQVTVTVTTILGDTTTLDEGTDYTYNSVSDEVSFYFPVTNTDTIQFSVAPDYSITDLSTQFSDLGVAPAEGSNLRDKQLLQMARNLDARILALGGQGAGGGTSAGVSSLVVGESSYDDTIQIFAGTGLSFIEGASSFQIELDASILNAPANITNLESTVSTLDSTVGTLSDDVSTIRQVPDASSAAIGQVLTVNNSNEAEWQTPSGGGGGGGSTTISGLDDVTLTTLADGDILVASGGDFVNQAPNFLTSGDVSAVALDNDYNSLSNLPTIPLTIGSWNLITDRPSGVTVNIPNSATIQSGYIMRWGGSSFTPARLDIADINVAGNQPVADLVDGTREPVLQYGSGNANKVLAVNSDGSALEWATQTGGSSGISLWQATLDNTNAGSSRGDYGNTGRWDWGSLALSGNFDTDIDGWSEDITLGTSLGSLDPAGKIFTVAVTGTYRAKYDVTLALEDNTAHSYHCMDVALVRKLSATTDGLNDDVVVRAPLQTAFGDISTRGDDRTVTLSTEKYVSLTAGDEIYFFLAGNTPDFSEIGVLLGTWILEKVD